jgi:hypothetical protein
MEPSSKREFKDIDSSWYNQSKLYEDNNLLNRNLDKHAFKNDNLRKRSSFNENSLTPTYKPSSFNYDIETMNNYNNNNTVKAINLTDGKKAIKLDYNFTDKNNLDHNIIINNEKKLGSHKIFNTKNTNKNKKLLLNKISLNNTNNKYENDDNMDNDNNEKSVNINNHDRSSRVILDKHSTELIKNTNTKANNYSNSKKPIHFRGRSSNPILPNQDQVSHERTQKSSKRKTKASQILNFNWSDLAKFNKKPKNKNTNTNNNELSKGI